MARRRAPGAAGRPGVELPPARRDAAASAPEPSPTRFRPRARRRRPPSAYARELRERVPAGPDGVPALDLALLGLGEDGHTASLFPHAPALDVRGEVCVAVHDAPKPPPDRVSLTLDVLRAARRSLILAVGDGEGERRGRGSLGPRPGGARQPARRRAAGADRRPSRRARAPGKRDPGDITRHVGRVHHRHPAHPARRLERAAGPSRRDPGHAPAHAVRRRPRPRRADDGRGRRPFPRLLQEPGHRRDDAAAVPARRGVRRCPSAARRCSAASGSTSPRTAPVLHVALRMPRERSLVVDGVDVVKEVHEVLDRMGDFCRAGPRGRVARPHRQADPQRDQHRDRRLGPGAR